MAHHGVVEGAAPGLEEREDHGKVSCNTGDEGFADAPRSSKSSSLIRVLFGSVKAYKPAAVMSHLQ